MSTFIKMPPEKLLEAVKLADAYPMNAARLLCDWWIDILPHLNLLVAARGGKEGDSIRRQAARAF